MEQSVTGFRLTLCCLLLLTGKTSARFKNKPPSLSVLCTSSFVRVTVLLERHDFYGAIYTRPDKSSCSVLGIGEPEISLFIPLSEPGMTQCGVALQDGVYSVVIDVREHHLIEMANDISFLVQCSATGSTSPQPRGQLDFYAHTSLKVLQNDQIVSHAIIGERYTLQMDLPNYEMYRVASCVAFSGNETIKFIPLMDNKGCPVEDLMTPFYPAPSQEGGVRAELKMFRFNDSTHFHIQCMINYCKTKCPQVVCGKRKDANLIGARVSAGNEEEAMAAQRVVVVDTETAAALVEYGGCNYGSNSRLLGLSTLLAMLATFTAILCTFAVYNRPFRCHILPRDDSSSGFIEFAPSFKSLSRGSMGGSSTMKTSAPQAPPIPPKMGNLSSTLKSARSLATIPPPPVFSGTFLRGSRPKRKLGARSAAMSEASTLRSNPLPPFSPPSLESSPSSPASSRMSGEYFLPQSGASKSGRGPPPPPPRKGSQLSSPAQSGGSSPSLPPPPFRPTPPPRYSPSSRSNSNYQFPSPPPPGTFKEPRGSPTFPHSSIPLSTPHVPPRKGSGDGDQKGGVDNSDALSVGSVSSAGSGGSRVPLSKSRPSLPPAKTGRFSSSSILSTPSLRNTIGEKYTSLRNMINNVRGSAYDLYHQQRNQTLAFRAPVSNSHSHLDELSTATQL